MNCPGCGRAMVPSGTKGGQRIYECLTCCTFHVYGTASLPIADNCKALLMLARQSVIWDWP